MKRVLPWIVLAALLVFFSLPAAAQSAGFDLLQTASGSSVDLSSVGLGVVPLQGVPIAPSLGNTDTIMHRDANGPGSVPLHVFALFMKSKSPVTFNGTSCDVYVTINDSGGVFSTSVIPQPDALADRTALSSSAQTALLAPVSLSMPISSLLRQAPA